MSYKTNIIIGVFLIVIVFIISILTYYFSLGPCPSGSFACDNGTTCVPYRSLCNNRHDCKDGSDEDKVECGNFAGNRHTIEHIMNKTIALSSPGNKSPNISECDLVDFPKGQCVCIFKTRLLCRNNTLQGFPINLPKSLTYLYLAHNFINFVPDEPLNFPELVYLNLKMTNISTISQNLFSQLQNLTKLYLNGNNIKTLPPKIFRNLPALEWLFLDSNQLEDFSLDELSNLDSLVWINLSHNQLLLKGGKFPPLPKIEEMLLNSNRIEEIDEFLFFNLNNLRYLNLDNNKINSIHQSAFQQLTELKELRLSSNLLVELPDGVFGQTNLDSLYLGFNNIDVTAYAMQNVNVSYLNLDGIKSSKINFKVLTNMTKLEIVVYEEFFYCSMTPSVKKCTPKSDGISSVTDLLTKPILRYSAWVMAILTCFGNVLVIWGRSTLRDENRTVSMVIRNLAVADMLMGFYLAIIGVQDFRYREIYNTRAHEWIESWSCVATGILAMISSEVSMLIMAFMSVERFLLIADPFGGYQKLNGHNVFFSLFSIWLLGTTLAILPVIVWRSSTLFYGKYSGTCFPLHLQEKYALGWQYSAFVFIGLNMTLLVVIAILYSALLFSIWRTRKATPLSMLDCEFVIRFFFIVFTDASCWIPIIIYKVLVFMSVQISADMYAWLIVFILPLNSAINPLLYTFTTPRYRDKFFWNSWYKIKWRNHRRNGSAGTSNQDDSQGKIMPLLYTTTENQKNWRF